MRGSVPVIAAMLFLPCLSSCAVKTERMRIHFDDERRGSFSLAASADEAKKDANTNPFQITKDDTQVSVEDKLKACGLSALTFKAQGRLHINARASFSYPDELETALACLPSRWDVVNLDSRRDEGLLRYTYTTTLRLEQPRVAIDTSDESGPLVTVAQIDAFPRALSLTVPGTISDIKTDETDILGARFEAREYGSEEVRATLTEGPTYEADAEQLSDRAMRAVQNGRLNGKNVSRLRRNVYALTIISYQWKLRLQDILSILGVLFGSGFIVQFVRGRLPEKTRRRKG